jgi:adenosylhomocysteine nucleosidase
MATSKTLVSRVEQKRQLGSQAQAVEMESYTILAEAARCGIPAVAIRAISDTADFDMPYNFEDALDKQGQIRMMGIASQVLRRPSAFPALLKLARDSRFASRRLADFLDAFAGTMADRLIPIEQDTVAAL